MVYRINRNPIIDDNGVLRVDIIQTEDAISELFTGIGGNASHGYVSGGQYQPPTTPPFVALRNDIERFPFSSDANASDVGDITVARGASGTSSSTHGYNHSGGFGPPGFNHSNVIDKFLFSSSANSTDVGDCFASRTGGGNESTTHGYQTGGRNPGSLNIIHKYPFSSDANSTDVGDLTQARYIQDGVNDDTHGYTGGGSYGQLTVDRYTFASDGNAVDVGDLTATGENAAGVSSATDGYFVKDTFKNKMPFASNTISSVTTPTSMGTGNASSSSTHGYVSADGIDKFPFASEGSTTSVGTTLVTHSSNAGGQQG